MLTTDEGGASRGLIVDISKRLGHFRLRAAFQSKGGLMGLLGPSGCGKSLTLQCIAGVLRPDEGHIELNGVTLYDSKRHIDLPPQQRRVGYLFQHYALFPNMTVRQNILCGLCREPDRGVRERRLADAVRLARLEGLENSRPFQLSGGQQQRTALARILASSPGLLLLDEPFSALDSHLRAQLQLETKALLEGFGKPVLMVTHSRDEAYRLCGHIAVMENGQILTHKDTKALFADPESRAAATLTGCKNLAAARKTGEYELEVPQWGVRLQTALPLRDELCAVGVRAHYFHPKATQNLLPVCFVDELEEPFETILRFRYEGQAQDAPALWWRIPKDHKPSPFPRALGVAAVNVLPLYR